MRTRFTTILLLGTAGVIGCDSGVPVVTNPAQLKPQTEEEIKISKDMDQKINEEEGGSFDPKSSKAPAARR